MMIMFLNTSGNAQLAVKTRKTIIITEDFYNKLLYTTYNRLKQLNEIFRKNACITGTLKAMGPFTKVRTL